jgi:predicted 3-demethylubiquinone-9 3-methyltransferase (glyoxalase superfamily)
MEAPHDPSANLPEGALIFAQYKLSGYLINSMSGPGSFDFDFNEAVSLMVYCENQQEIDYFWEKLTDGGQEQPCGWLKDRFGVSWQIVPYEMDEMMQTADKVQLNRVMKAMMPMMKLNLAILNTAFLNS